MSQLDPCCQVCIVLLPPSNIKARAIFAKNEPETAEDNNMMRQIDTGQGL